MSKIASFIQQNRVAWTLVLLAIVLCGVFVSRDGRSPEVRKAADKISSFLDAQVHNPYDGSPYDMDLSGAERRVATRMISAICEGDLVNLQRLVVSQKNRQESRTKIGPHLTMAFWRAGAGYIVVFMDRDGDDLSVLPEQKEDKLGLAVRPDKATVFSFTTEGEGDTSTTPEVLLKTIGEQVVDNVNSGRFAPKDN